MSEKRKEKKLLNALTLILDLCCKDPAKQKYNIPLEKEFCYTYKSWWKDQKMEKRDNRGGRVQTNTRLEVKSSRLGSRGLRVNC